MRRVALPMILDLSRIRQAETVLDRQYQPADFDGRGNQFRVRGPIRLKGTVHKDHARFRLVGDVSGVLELSCSRCLEAFDWPVEARFDVRYLPQSENVGDEREVEEDDLSDAFYRDDVIDLGQLIDEQFYLALPMKPLCQHDCKGLCSSCGANLNADRCDCDVRWKDPRLSGLKSLLNETKDHA
jgi:uncharacterized protein